MYMHTGASIYPHANANAVSGSIHGPIIANGNANDIELTKTFDAPFQIQSKKDILLSHTEYCMQHAAYMWNLSFKHFPSQSANYAS